MAKSHNKSPAGKAKPAPPVRRDTQQDAQRRKLLRKHYNNKYHVR